MAASEVSLSAIIESISAALTAAGFTPNSYAAGLKQDAADRKHKGFSVYSPSSVMQTFDERGKWDASASWLAVLDSQVEVALTFQVRGQAQVLDYKGALDLEVQAIRAVMGIDRTHVNMQPVSISRSSGPGNNQVLVTLQFSIRHRQAIGAA